MDTFQLKRAFEREDDEDRRLKSISATISKVLRGEAWLDDLVKDRQSTTHRMEAFYDEPELIIDNSLSDNFTVIEASTRDRAGLLYDLTSAISDLNLDITSAHITTYGEKAVDVFYVTDLTGKKVTDTKRQEIIKQRLDAVLEASQLQLA